MRRHARRVGWSAAVVVPLVGGYLHLRSDAARDAVERAKIEAEAQQARTWQYDFQVAAQLAQRCGK